MTTALQIIDGGNKRDRRSSEKATTRSHCKVSIDDVNWIRQQAPCVQQLWLDCVAAEQFGGAAHKLNTNLSRNSFLKASAVINGAGLFEFEEVRSKTQSGRSGVTSYRVKNLHGYFNRHYWENFDNQSVTVESQAVIPENQQVMPQNHQMMSERQNLTFSEAKKPTQQEFQKPNNVSNNPLTTYQQPTKVVGMVVGSDALARNPRVEETAHAPLRGASPSHIESASELEELPVAMDCTTLALVDDAPSQSALLIGESQDCGVEATISHEGTFSATLVAVNEFSSTLAIANQTQEEVEQSNSAPLSGENQVSGFEQKDCDEGTNSAAPVSLNQSEIFEWLDRANLGECPPLWVIQYLLDSKYYASMRATISKFEKQWNLSVVNYQVQESSEALFTAESIATRSKARLLRMEKLKMASLVGENPGFDFLQQCCHDDPPLQIVIKKLLAKFPQWGIACIDGVLVNTGSSSTIADFEGSTPNEDWR